MTDVDAQQLYRVAARRLRAQKVYNVVSLQDGLGLPVLEILEAVDAGEIPRSLGLKLDTCVLGNDICDWLKSRTIPRHNGRVTPRGSSGACGLV